MELHVLLLWTFMEHHARLSVTPHDVTGNSVKIHGNSMEISMEFYCLPWNAMEFHGESWPLPYSSMGVAWSLPSMDLDGGPAQFSWSPVALTNIVSTSNYRSVIDFQSPGGRKEATLAESHVLHAPIMPRCLPSKHPPGFFPG